MSILAIDLRWIDASGVGTYIQNVVPGIIEQLADVSIVGVGRRSRLEEFAWSHATNVRLVECLADRYSIAEQIQLPLVIPKGTDLFFSPYYTIPLLYRGRLAVTVHDMSHLVVPEIVKDVKKRLYARMMFRALRKRAAIIFTVSQFSKAELVRLTAGSTDENILPTPLGISEQWFTAAQLPLPRQRPYLICVGNIKPYKNLARLVEAFLRIRDRISQDLVIVGQSEGLLTGESPEFFKRVNRAGERIYLTGHVTQHDLLSLVGHADALIMPSLYEGFGLPPLEAMAAGTAVAVARAASLPEVCGDAALYFDPLSVADIAEKLLLIATNSTLRQQLRTSGFANSTRFSWSGCSKLTADALRVHLRQG